MGNVILTDELLEHLGDEYQEYLGLCDRAGEEIEATSFQVYVQTFLYDAQKSLATAGSVPV